MLAANRDERYDRPAQHFTVLREDRPRTLGGKDLVAGGTWLAVNEYGVVAGLTNTPSREGPDPSKRSRGELPLLLTAYSSAEKGVEAFVHQVQSGVYNETRLIVCDRDHLFYIELPGSGAPVVKELPPGLHVLENAPLEEQSSKARLVEGLLSDYLGSAEDLWRALPNAVASHAVAAPTREEIAQSRGLSRWPSTRSPCVHSEGYGTRSSMLLRVAKAASVPTEIMIHRGPPCTTALHDVTSAWAH